MSIHCSAPHQGRGGDKSLRQCVARLLGSVVVTIAGAGVAGAASVEIADAPIPTGSSLQVKPNIMFVLDNSGSMERTYLPDFVLEFTSGTYGFASASCNGSYYDPTITYTPPVKADGSSYPASSFAAAPMNGFDLLSQKVDLGTQFKAVDWGCVVGTANCDPEEPAYYYQYTRPNKGPEPLQYAYSADGKVDVKEGMYPYCSSAVGKTPGRNVFEKITSNDSGFDKQNFANWYTYYRSRLNAMKSSAGRAFSQLSNPGGLRIGFSTLNAVGVSANARFQPIGDFCAPGAGDCDPGTQRNEIFDKLYGTTAEGTLTPLRSAMAKIGRMYAGFHEGSRLTGSDDPVLYSCQQNFLIMATDGSWVDNGSAHFNIANSGGVGDQDGGAVRPMLDAYKAPDTLADIAMYYANTDLRDSSLGNCTGGLGEDVCADDVSPSAGSDKTSQSMTTFTLGFGVDGSLRYEENYESGASIDYNGILSGSKNWPNPKTDQPGTDTYFRVDDLWHAAVNGRGIYFSAKTPDALIGGLARALGTPAARVGSGSGAATSSLEPVSGDNFAYVASYRTQEWYGDLEAREINVITGELASADQRLWSAKVRLDQLAADTGWSSRKIYMKGSGTTRLDFTGANVRSVHGALPAASTSDELINFIRGDASREDQAGNDVRTQRDRTHILGDIVSSHPVYVRRPPYKYSDSGYADYVAAKSARTGIVLVGANDGMLHAFDAQTGVERWAYVPSAVIPNLHKLAHLDYGNSTVTPHQYYVDGAIAVGDICIASNCASADGSDWRTIAVVGLGKGGRSYFALDITDTTNPSILWEFDQQTDPDVGLTFGNPIITKKAGQWVVLFASGYNNESPGDGKGRLFVVNAKTGAKISEIIADTGSDPSQSGIAKISNWVDNLRLDDSTQYVYAGDLFGRLWRFDLTNESVTQLASFGSTQPITTRPELAQVKAGDGSLKRVVFVGTGKYLGQSDLDDASLQSIYAVRDPLENTGWGDFRGVSGVIEQVITASGTKRTITNKALDWTTAPGWFVDLDSVKGERINIDFKITSGVLTVVGNVPEHTSCLVGGRSYLYFFDYRTGSSVQTVDGSLVGELLTNALGVGLAVVRVDGREKVIINTSDNRQITRSVPPLSASGTFRRMSWRELVN